MAWPGLAWAGIEVTPPGRRLLMSNPNILTPMSLVGGRPVRSTSWGLRPAWGWVRNGLAGAMIFHFSRLVYIVCARKRLAQFT